MNRKTIRKIIVGLLFCVFAFSMAVNAEEINYSRNILVETTKETKLYKQPNKTSEEMATFEAHTILVTLADQVDDWILVKHHDVEGYLEVTNLELYQAEGIEQEFEAKENEYNLIFSEIEYINNQKHQQLVWGITICLLVIAIFAVGIVSTVLNDKKMKETKKNQCVVSKGNANETNNSDSVL